MEMWTKDRLKRVTMQCDRPELVQYLCMAVVIAVELLYFLFEYRCHGIMLFVVERYAAVPAMIFIGAALCSKMTPEGKKQLLIGMLMLLWFFVIEVIRQSQGQGLDKKELGAFFCAYALFLPFAALTQDGKRQWGLKMMAALFLTVNLIQMIYAVLLLTDHVPVYLQGYVFWAGVRLWAVGHPNVCATLLMIGMAFCAGMLLRVKNVWLKGLLLITIAVQFAIASLTNARTTMVFTCIILGGNVFCFIRGKSWKRLPVALIAALAIMVGLFAVSGRVFEANQVRLSTPKPVVQVLEQAETQLVQEEAQGEEAQGEAVSQQVQISGADQGSWSKDLRSLNGRTQIWSSALKGLREYPQICLIGTDSVGSIISQFNSFDVEHSHNSWVEVLYQFGLPGLAIALLLTFMAVRGALIQLWRNTDLWKSCISLLTLCLMGCAMLEPYLFTGNIFYYFFNFLFLLCVGYLELWRKEKE